MWHTGHICEKGGRGNKSEYTLCTFSHWSVIVFSILYVHHCFWAQQLFYSVCSWPVFHMSLLGSCSTPLQWLLEVAWCWTPFVPQPYISGCPTDVLLGLDQVTCLATPTRWPSTSSERQLSAWNDASGCFRAEIQLLYQVFAGRVTSSPSGCHSTS